MYNHSNEGTNLPYGFDQGDCERQSGCAYSRPEKRYSKEDKETARELLQVNELDLQNPNIISKSRFYEIKDNLLAIINS